MIVVVTGMGLFCSIRNRCYGISQKALVKRAVVLGTTADLQPKTAREEEEGEEEEVGMNRKNSNKGSVTGSRRSRVMYKWLELKVENRRCAITNIYVQVNVHVGLRVMAHMRNAAYYC